MKTLIIHPKDPTTDFLSTIYSGQNWTIINTNVFNSYLKDQIKFHDRIILLGHGTSLGLIGFNHIIINSTFVYLLREKECVCIWCNADQFAKKYKLRGFFTGMIISEELEALYYGIEPKIDEITESNLLFANSIKTAINSSNMLNEVKLRYCSDTNTIIKFNKNNIYQFEPNLVILNT